jgi:hypothetical protein
MSWFSRSRKVATAPAPEEEAPELHRSLGLAALFESMRRRGQGLRILDLGSAVGSNVEFLSQLGCKLHIEDLFASRTAAVGEEILGPEFFEQLLAQPDDVKFDVVLAWDLFNYLQRKELAHLATVLRKRCRPGALLLALVSIHKQVPAQPIRFRIQSENELLYEHRTSLERPGPRYAPAELNSLLKGFRVDRSFLLRHGVQEYLFVREDDGHPRP